MAAINTSYCLPRLCWTKNIIASCVPTPASAVREDRGLAPGVGGRGNPKERWWVGPMLHVSQPNNAWRRPQRAVAAAVVAMLLPACGRRRREDEMNGK